MERNGGWSHKFVRMCAPHLVTPYCDSIALVIDGCLESAANKSIQQNISIKHARIEILLRAL